MEQREKPKNSIRILLCYYLVHQQDVAKDSSIRLVLAPTPFPLSFSGVLYSSSFPSSVHFRRMGKRIPPKHYQHFITSRFQFTVILIQFDNTQLFYLIRHCIITKQYIIKALKQLKISLFYTIHCVVTPLTSYISTCCNSAFDFEEA